MSEQGRCKTANIDNQIFIVRPLIAQNKQLSGVNVRQENRNIWEE